MIAIRAAIAGIQQQEPFVFPMWKKLGSSFVCRSGAVLMIYLDFPLDKGVGIWVAVDAEEEEPLALFVVAVVGVKNL